MFTKLSSKGEYENCYFVNINYLNIKYWPDVWKKSSLKQGILLVLFCNIYVIDPSKKMENGATKCSIERIDREKFS